MYLSHYVFDLNIILQIISSNYNAHKSYLDNSLSYISLHVAKHVEQSKKSNYYTKVIVFLIFVWFTDIFK